MSSDHSYVASVVASYWFISISMVYLNKVLMSSKSVSIEAPLFITWFQCVVTAAICWAAGELALKFKKAEYEAVAKEEGDDEAAAAKPSFWSQFPKADYRWSVAKKVFPLSLIFVGMITFNNLCLMWVEVSFYNVARSLTIVFNVILSQYILGSYTSPKTMACLAIVIFGFFMGSKGELNFSLWGTLSGVLSSLFVSLNSIFTKKVLPAVDNDHWKLTFYNNVNACILFIPMMIVFEGPVIIQAFGDQFLSLLFWSAMLVAGFFGFMIGTCTSRLQRIEQFRRLRRALTPYCHARFDGRHCNGPTNQGHESPDAQHQRHGQGWAAIDASLLLVGERGDGAGRGFDLRRAGRVAPVHVCEDGREQEAGPVPGPGGRRNAKAAAE